MPSHTPMSPAGAILRHGNDASRIWPDGRSFTYHGPDAAYRAAYAARAAELAAMDATRHTIINAAPKADEDAEYVAHRDGLAEGGR